MFLAEQTKREEHLKQRRLTKEKAKKPTKEAGIQCDRQETADSKLASEIGVQTDFSAVVMEDLTHRRATAESGSNGLHGVSSNHKRHGVR